MSPDHLPDGWSIHWLDEVDSTNDHLHRSEYPPGTVVVAKRQTQGRGRRQNRWQSVEGESLTFSVLLRPTVPLALWPRLSLAAGLAVAETLEKMGYEAGLKWPNDLWIRERKVGGILVESSDDGAVVGIGLNLGMRDFDPGIEATSLLIEDGRHWEAAEVLDLLLPRLAGRSASIGDGFEAMLEEIRRRCVLSGRRVVLRTSRGEQTGEVVGIGSKGELLLRTADGVLPVIQAEEVRPVS
ncbi:biotin--[acetyl-CoA-carboxylase] ligase [Haloferula sp. A504]|uniref:biotin--[acetyl-CoA-carboxylase] ligase n=1 Tax=Haloferula sp. A504 TaxID=3373601 RepID=UPI0031C84493|nr:biotin--[acetyl-CoA-carboxylase] ligase [Verrucomicrobiaceae bacterium E54]